MENIHLKDTHFVIFDYETLNPYGLPPQPIELAAAVVAPGLQRIEETFSMLIKPPAHVPFTRFNIELTGITPELVTDAPDAYTVMKEFNRMYSDKNYIFVAHNARYDHGILKQYPQEAADVLRAGFVDTVILAKQLLPMLPNRKLDTVAAHFGFKLDEGRHRALPDSILTADVLIKLLEIAIEKGMFSSQQLIKAAAIKKPTPLPPATTQPSLFDL